MKTYSIITARTSSSRLPGKILKTIKKNYKSIDILISRAKKIGYPIILATTYNKNDNKLCKYVKKNHKVDIFRGSEKNKLLRWYNCFKKFNIDRACMIDGDDICFDYELYKKASKLNFNNKLIHFPNKIITGCFLYILDFKILKKIQFDKSKNFDTEMVDPFFKISKIKKNIIKIKKIYFEKNLRLTLDYKEDFDLFKIIFKRFVINTKTETVIKFLKKNKKLGKINYFREAQFKDNQTKKINKAKTKLF